jgi:hypothetical protein
MTFLLILALTLAPAEKQQVKDLHEQAKRAYNVGKYSEAEWLFSQCYLTSGSPEFLYNGAQSARQAGHGPEAVRLYKAFLRERPEASNRPRIETWIRDLESKAPAPAAQASAADLSDPFEPPKGAGAPVPVPPASFAQARPAAPTPTRRWAPWAVAGATAALAAGAVVAGLAADARHDRLAATCAKTEAGCSAAEVEGLRTRATAANVLWGLTAAGVVGTGAMFVFAGRF